jgi:NodT family efflux transporter outer membrane factor (OMF) lipoprotein
MKALRPCLSLLAAASLAGCVSLAPRYERPAAPVAAVFPYASAASAAAGAETSAPREWQSFFADARLRRLIELSLANNRDLRVAVLNVEAARAQVGLRRADEFPTVGLGVGASRAPSPVTGQELTTYTAGLSVASYELDLFGRVRSLTDAALAQLQASEEARKTAQISLVASVAGTYYALRGDDELIALSRQTLKTREESMRLTKLKFDNGVASDFDLQTARSTAEAARIALAQQQHQRDLDQDALELLLGQPMPTDLPAAGPWRTDVIPDVPAGLPSDVLLRRPDVRQAEQQLIAANADIGAARAAFLPSISLTGSFGTASTELGQLFHHSAWTFAGQLLQPIFDAGRNSANLRASKVQRDIAVAQYERAVQSAFRDVADALAGRVTLEQQLSATAAQTDAESRRFQLSDLRYRQGVASSLELLDAQRSLFAAQQALIQTQLAAIQNRIGVYRALGGGWSEPAQASAAR